MSDIEQAVAEALDEEGFRASGHAVRALLAALAVRGYHVTRSEGLDVERLASALDYALARVDGGGYIASARALAEDIAREYGGTRSDREAAHIWVGGRGVATGGNVPPRSDREARLEAALRDIVSHLGNIGWHEGRTPDFSCMKGEDARRLDDLYDAAEALLSEAPE